MTNIEQPLVSVGIPTYERPEGLRNTLRYITQQTYPNLEIIISDNCSSSDETRAVAEQFMSDYPYIKYFRQERNIGVMANFQFVLERASGEYYMWAADDDEWENDFIEVCLGNSESGCSVMTGFVTHYRNSGLRISNRLPNLECSSSPYRNAETFLNCMQPTLFYGLHARKSILFFLTDDFFYFYDCYFVLRIILEKGFKTLPSEILYAAGVDSDEYVIKHPGRTDKTKLEYWPFFRAAVVLILKSNRVRQIEKFGLIKDISVTVARLIRFHEKLPLKTYP
jgi:glycosyltransferase involved in cell wall biosynthesis